MTSLPYFKIEQANRFEVDFFSLDVPADSSNPSERFSGSSGIRNYPGTDCKRSNHNTDHECFDGAFQHAGGWKPDY